MIKLLVNIIELYVVTKVIYSTAKFLLGKKQYGKGKTGKSIMGKIAYLLGNRIHDALDHIIKSQKRKRLAVTSPQADNTIEFKVYRKVKSN